MIINIAQQSFLDHYFKILYTNIFIQIILIQTEIIALIETEVYLNNYINSYIITLKDLYK